MIPMFHFFCKKPNINDPETANIKSIHITGVKEISPAIYDFEIEYKNGEKVERSSRAQTLHDKYSQFLDPSFVRSLHNEARQTQRKKM